MRFSKLGMLAALAGGAWMGSSADAAVVISTADGNGADALLQNDSQDAGTGPAVVRSDIDTFTIRNLDNARVKIGIVRFDLSGATGDLTGATLSLDIVFNNGNRNRTINVYGLIDDAINDAWDEATISYSTAPGFIYTDPDPGTTDLEPTNDYTIDPAEMTLLGTFETGTTTPPTTVTTLTSALNLDAFLANDTNGLVTFAFIFGGSDSNVTYEIATKEHATALAPRLILPNAIPEPASLALASLGGLALLSRRRA